ncbi:helix-turn-helix transcriptional regulator [Spirochaeta cellobiosiphila]|uniref:helix-turn-helix transcriptional regulator n=1 Tax=Spirochaeta cellobiosiphila TaxID=504483 RepID=UPI000429EB87|nr:WYL domain-containing protein [Spirochaeta cellobiosiphila]
MNEKDKAIYHIDILLRNKDKNITNHEDMQKALSEVGIYKNTESIKKYLADMRSAGAPIVKEKGCYRYENKHYIHPLVELTPDDYLQFQFTIAGLEVYKNTPLYHHSQELLRKFTTEDDQNIDNWLHQHVSILPESWVSIQEEVWNHLLESLNNSHYVIIEYQRDSSVEAKKVTLEPYHIYFVKGNWYLIGRNKSRDRFTTYALSRINQVSVLEEQFKRESFDFESFIDQDNYGFFGASSSPFLVKVLVDINKGHWIYERRWTADQKLSPYDDTNLLLEFYANNEWEVRYLILSWGASVQVLEPKDLVDNIKEELHHTLSKYQTKS